MKTDARSTSGPRANDEPGHARDLAVRASWLYHVEGLTQQQVAEAIGISRARIARLLAAALDEGIVSIRIGARSGERIALERRLIARYGLDDAFVAPGSADEAGAADATFLREQARDGMSIGVGWGATLSAAARVLEPRPLRGASVISLLGGMTHSRGVNPSAVARRVADAFAADCYQLTAPLVVADARVRDALWAEPALRALRQRASKAGLALVSVGEVSARATLFRERVLPADTLESLRAAGAIADVLGRFVDAHGRPIAHAVNERVVAVDVADLRRVPRFVVASGGERKVEALRAALAAVRVHVLITDEPAARGLLEC